MAMGRWYLKGSRLPSQASPAGKKPVFIFKERAPIGSPGCHNSLVASEGLRTPRHRLRRGSASPTARLHKHSGMGMQQYPRLLILPDHWSHHSPCRWVEGWVGGVGKCKHQEVPAAVNGSGSAPQQHSETPQGLVLCGGVSTSFPALPERMGWLVCCRVRVTAGGRPPVFEA